MKKTLAGKGSFDKKGRYSFSFAAACAASLLIAGNCFGSTITLQWDPVTAPDLAGYKVYYSTSNVAPFSGTGAVQGTSPVDVTAQTTTTVTGLDPAIPYYFAITAYSTAGVESAYSNIVEVPELVPPSVTITSPSSSTASGTVSVTASASDNVGVAKLEFYVNGQMQGTDTTTPYLYSWDTSNVASGSYTLMAKAYDAAGNIGQSEPVNVNVVHDTTAPTVSVTAPAAGATIHGSVPIAAAASDDVGVTKVEFFANGILLTAGNVAPYSFTWDTTTVSNGSYTIFSKAYDAQGNVTQSANVSVNVLNDTAAPAVSIASPVNNTTATGSVVVSINATDNVAVKIVEFYVNGAMQGTSSNAPYSFRWDTTALANGSYTLTAKAYDTTGNVGQSGNVAINVFNDKAAPIASIVSPTANSTAGGSVLVSANASDDVAVSKVEFYMNGALQATSTIAPYNYSWNTTAAANGSYLLTAKAYDAAGNVGQSANVTVNVFNDKAAPTVSIVSPTANSTAGGSVLVSANASDDVAVSKVEFYVNGALQTTSSSAPYNFTWNTSTVANGSYTLTAKAYDAAGNIGQSSSVAVKVLNDATAPAITFLAPTTTTVYTSKVTVKASATDDVAVVKMQLFIDGVLKTTTTSGSLSAAVSLNKGLHTILVKALDSANNLSSKSMTVQRVY